MSYLPLILFACALALFAVYKARQHRQRQIAANELAWATLKQLLNDFKQQHYRDNNDRSEAELALFKQAFVEGYHANEGNKKVAAKVSDLRRQNQALALELQALYPRLRKAEKEASDDDILLVLLHLAFSEGGLRMFEAQGRKRLIEQQRQLLRQRWQQLKAKAN
ncbi:hypothetical protein [Ferrimonas senticii]|uniref:hypothetical protein n=1 Tax=Ferrimonas senticii TaxID=394566 RepID=UPI000425DA38|nr:hypothetical protein [Ferrimonas senticii]